MGAFDDQTSDCFPRVPVASSDGNEAGWGRPSSNSNGTVSGSGRGAPTPFSQNPTPAPLP